MAAGAAAGAWVLVLSLWGEPLPPTLTLPAESTPPPTPQNLPRTFLERGHCFSSSLTHPVLVLLAPMFYLPLYCGAVSQEQ